MQLCALTVILAVVYQSAGLPRNTVTNEDIANTIISAIRMIRITEDKLERHEYRERVLGEQIKKSLLSLDKRLKLLEPFKGTVSRLDERLAAVESILIQQDERERIQMQKTIDSLDAIQKIIPATMEQMKTELLNELKNNKVEPIVIEDTLNKNDLKDMANSINEKIDNVDKSVNTIGKDLKTLQDDKNNIEELNKKSNENLEGIQLQLNESKNLLEKYKAKLTEYDNKIDMIPQNDKTQNDLNVKVMEALKVHKSNVEQIMSDVKTINGRLDDIPRRNEVEKYHNESLRMVNNLQSEVVQQNTKTIGVLREDKQQLTSDRNNKHSEIIKLINELNSIVLTLTDKLGDNFSRLQKDVDALSELDQVMVQTADGVMDTKRRVEYGVQQILLEIKELLKTNTKQLNDSINERFNYFELSVLDIDKGALANLTTKIGEQIDQVWRQIGIMHQQMGASTDTLNKLQNQTDVYVNGSLNVMDGMKQKVGQITNRMFEMDENLNFLLGRFSLVTYEFNKIKTGLGKAIDQIRASFHEVNDKVQNKGPGPHNITTEVDTQ